MRWVRPETAADCQRMSRYCRFLKDFVPKTWGSNATQVRRMWEKVFPFLRIWYVIRTVDLFRMVG
jgi:hypothetical protein